MDGAFAASQIESVVERELSNCERAIKQGNTKRALAELEEAARKLANLAVHVKASRK